MKFLIKEIIKSIQNHFNFLKASIMPSEKLQPIAIKIYHNDYRYLNKR